MCIVIFSYFKESYLTSNDDLNVEYPVHPKTEYDWAFNLQIVAIVLSFISSVGYIFILNKPTMVRKNRSDEPLFSTYDA